MNEHDFSRFGNALERLRHLWLSDFLHLEMAAKGCISGTLSEWPELKEALRRHGVTLDGGIAAIDVANACRHLLDKYHMQPWEK